MQVMRFALPLYVDIHSAAVVEKKTCLREFEYVRGRCRDPTSAIILETTEVSNGHAHRKQVEFFIISYFMASCSTSILALID